MNKLPQGIAALVFVLVALAGCALPGKPKESSTYYVLNDPGPIQRLNAPRHGVLLIGEMNASAFYQDARLTFSRGATTRGRYQYAYWSEPPARRLSWLLRQRLEAAGAFETVIPVGAGVIGDYQLNTSLIDFYHDAAAEPGTALLILDAELVRRKTATLVDHRVFVAQVPVQSHDAEGAADALGRAANQVIDEIVTWLGRTVPAEAK